MKDYTTQLLEMSKNRKLDVIVLGCNTKNVMGAGIVNKIRVAYPEVGTFCSYKAAIGCCNHVRLKNGVYLVNAFIQVDPGKANDDYDSYEERYKAIRSVMKSLNKNFKGLRIGMAKIGAGVSGGNWETISSIINESLFDCNITILD